MADDFGPVGVPDAEPADFAELLHACFVEFHLRNSEEQPAIVGEAELDEVPLFSAFYGFDFGDFEDGLVEDQLSSGFGLCFHVFCLFW